MPGKHHLRGFKIAKKSARRFAARGRCSASSLAQTPPWKKARSAPDLRNMSEVGREPLHKQIVSPIRSLPPQSKTASGAPDHSISIQSVYLLIIHTNNLMGARVENRPQVVSMGTEECNNEHP